MSIINNSLKFLRYILSFFFLFKVCLMSGMTDEVQLKNHFFIVKDYTEGTDFDRKEFINCFNNDVEYLYYGFKFNLREVSGKIFIVRNDTLSILADPMFKIIKRYAQKETHDRVYLPLFIYYEGSQETYDGYIKKHGLDSNLVSLDKTTGDLFSINSNSKFPVVIFLKSHFSKQDGYNDQKEFLVDNDTSLKKNDCRKFFIINDLLTENEDTVATKYSHLYQEKLIKIWRSHGIYPSFLLNKSGENGYFDFRPLAQAVNNTHYIYGKFKCQDSIFPAHVYLKENVRTCLNSLFCYPLEAKGSFTPLSEGNSFVPESVVFGKAFNKKNICQDFDVKSLRLSEGLLAYYPFDEDFNDVTGMFNPENTYLSQIVKSRDRENVLNLELGGYIRLPDISRFDINDNDLTLSVWINIPSGGFLYEYVPILGAGKPQYREGLQLAMREKRIYFGFWHMDTHGNKVLEPNRWYHVVAKYNRSQEKATIYINGEKDCEVDNVKSFFADEGSFLVGKSVTVHDYVGLIDELAIWKRALNDKEVKMLYDGEKPEPVSSGVDWVYWGISLAGVFLIFVIAARLGAGEKKEKRKTEGSETVKVKGTGSVCVGEGIYKVFFFGQPAIYKDEENISSKISPKMLDLFMFLILNRCMGRDSITLREVTDSLWGDMELEKANNNRRVIVSRLKSYLSDYSCFKIVTDSKNEIGIFVSDDVWIDLMKYKEIVNSGVGEDEIYRLLEIIDRGSFMKNCKAEWIDKYYSDIYDETVFFLSELLDKRRYDNETLHAVAEKLIVIESCNEEAMLFLVKYYCNKGKIVIAENVYSHFCDNFYRSYQSYYKKTFDDIISEK